jgi:GDP-4-dehydro-6-deoxy-D-mannose reductase
LNIFITGATGFVGCFLRDYFRSSEHAVWGTVYPEKPDRASSERLFHADIRSEERVSSIIKQIRPDWVFHLAAVSNVRHSWEKRKETLETNIMGTFNLFEAVKQFIPEARILYVSSSDVYGAGGFSGKPIEEKADVKAVNPYAYTKLSGEILSDFYAQIEKLDIVTARAFPHTGPRQSADFVCSDWAYQIARIEKKKAKPELKVGNVSVHRDFTDVRDVVRAYVSLLEQGKSGEVYNVCSGKALSLRKVLEKLLSFAAVPIEVRLDSEKLRKADIPVLVGDNSKIRNGLSWEPEIPIEQSLEELLDYWRARA